MKVVQKATNQLFFLWSFPFKNVWFKNLSKKSVSVETECFVLRGDLPDIRCLDEDECYWHNNPKNWSQTFSWFQMRFNTISRGWKKFRVENATIRSTLKTNCNKRWTYCSRFCWFFRKYRVVEEVADYKKPNIWCLYSCW